MVIYICIVKAQTLPQNTLSFKTHEKGHFQLPSQNMSETSVQVVQKT